MEHFGKSDPNHFIWFTDMEKHFTDYGNLLVLFIVIP